MKKILFLLLLLPLFSMSQSDDTTLYTKYHGIYGLQYPRMMLTKVLRPPTDTIYTKTGIARIGSTLWVGNGTLWTAAGSGSGGGVDSVTFASGIATDTVLYWIGGTGYQAGIIDRKDGLIAGGVVHWDSLLVFTISPAIYYIGGVRYTSPQTTITLDPADVSNPRIDVIALDATGVIKITGTPAASPAEPQTSATEIRLTSILINTGATTPSGVSSTIIYDENVEWTGSAVGVTANFNGATNVFHFLKTTDVSSFTNGQSIKYTNGSTVDMTTFESLRFYLRLKATFAQSAQLQLTWMNGNTVVSNTINLTNNLYGYSRTTTGTYQVITIPVSDWAFSSASANALRITLAGTNASGFYIDYIQLQSGITQPPSGGVISVSAGWGMNFPVITSNGSVVVDSNVVATRAWRQKGDDSLGALINNLNPYRFGVSGEDYRATQNREFSGAGSYSLTIDSLSSVLFGFDPSNGLSFYDYITSTTIFRHNTTNGSQLFAPDGQNNVQVTNSSVTVNLNSSVNDSLVLTSIPYNSSARLVALQLDTVTNRVYRKTASGGGITSADAPLRITSSTVSADTSVSYDPSLTTNARLLKTLDSLRVSLTGVLEVLSYSMRVEGGGWGGGSSGPDDGDFANQSSGTGATNASQSSGLFPGWIGGMKFTTGTTSVGFGATHLSTGSLTYAQVVLDSLIRTNVGFKWRIDALSDGTDRFNIGCGLTDNTTATHQTVDGCYFRYRDDDSSGKIVIGVAKNSIRQEVQTSVTVAVNTDYVCEVSVYKGVAYYYVNGASVGTITPTFGMPYGETRSTGIGIGMGKTIGTNSRSFWWDWIAYGNRIF